MIETTTGSLMQMNVNSRNECGECFVGMDHRTTHNCWSERFRYPMIKPLIDQRPSKPSIHLHYRTVRTIRAILDIECDECGEGEEDCYCEDEAMDIGPSWRVTLGCTETFKPAIIRSKPPSRPRHAWNRKKRTPRDVFASKKNKQSSWMRRLSRNESKPKVNKVGDGQ